MILGFDILLGNKIESVEGARATRLLLASCKESIQATWYTLLILVFESLFNPSQPWVWANV